MMAQWEDVDPNDPDFGGNDDDNPFADVQQPDAIVYSRDEVAPELRMTGDHRAAPPPPPPRRPAPQPPVPRHVEPWKPGPDPTPAKPHSDTTSPLWRLLLGLVPLLILAGMLYVVYLVASAYGYKP